MQMFDAAAVRAALPWPGLIAALEEMFAGGADVPQRQSFTIANPKGDDGTLLLMPAWIGGDSIGVKAVTFFPGNTAIGLATINAAYLLFDGADGRLKGVYEGDELTVRRTAAASAVAAKRLARADAQHLLVVGTGQLSANMAAAHASVRAFTRIEIYGRNRDKAAAVVAALAEEGLKAAICEDLAASAAAADVISCCTSATEPVVRGAWLKPGAHLDLVGAFKGDMREADDEAVTRASLFVDLRPGAILAGDLAQPLAAGIIAESDIRADLKELVTGAHPGRTGDDEITFFKSVGYALEDLAAARLIAGLAE